MKYIKKLLFVLVLLFAVVLVGCNKGGEKDPGKKDPEKPTIDITQVAADVQGTFNKYSIADHGSFVLTSKSGETTSKVEMVYNYSDGSLDNQSTILTDAKGTMSVYIKDSKAYINRYDLAKTVIDVKESEGEDLVEKYNFNSFVEIPMTLLNGSFFKSSEIVSQENGDVKIELNIGTYDIDMEEESEILTNIFDGIKEKDSVTLDVFYTENAVSKILVTIVGNDVTSTIELEFRGTAEDEIAITFPDFSEYTK